MLPLQTALRKGISWMTAKLMKKKFSITSLTQPLVTWQIEVRSHCWDQCFLIPALNARPAAVVAFLWTGYNRRFGIIVYETCVGLLAFVALILNVMDTEYTDSDIIIFAVTFILNLLTYSSGIVITVALGFQMCYKRKRAVNTDKPQNLRLDF